MPLGPVRFGGRRHCALDLPELARRLGRGKAIPSRLSDERDRDDTDTHHEEHSERNLQHRQPRHDVTLAGRTRSCRRHVVHCRVASTNSCLDDVPARWTRQPHQKFGAILRKPNSPRSVRFGSLKSPRRSAVRWIQAVWLGPGRRLRGDPKLHRTPASAARASPTWVHRLLGLDPWSD